MVNSQAIEKAVETILGLAADAEAPTIAERDLVRRVIEFANTGRPLDLPGARVATHGGRSFIVLTEDLGARQTELQRDLGAIVSGELAAPAIARLRKQAGRQVLVPSFDYKGGAVKVSHRHLTADLGATVSYVLLRVQSDERLRNDVKWCRLPGCGRFFLASEQITDPSAPGRRRYRYCTPEHMNEAQTSGAERTKRWRDRLAKRTATAAKHK